MYLRLASNSLCCWCWPSADPSASNFWVMNISNNNYILILALSPESLLFTLTLLNIHSVFHRSDMPYCSLILNTLIHLYIFQTTFLQFSLHFFCFVVKVIIIISPWHEKCIQTIWWHLWTSDIINTLDHYDACILRAVFLRNLTVSSGLQYFKYYIFILLLLPDRQVLPPLPCVCVAYTVKTQEKHSPIKIKTFV